MSPAGRPGPDVWIGRLALQVSGLDEGTARALARLVAQGLPPEVAGLAGGLGRVRIQVTVDAAEQGRPELLARRIANELGRVLAGGQARGGPGAGPGVGPGGEAVG